jgi:hypothetical protein
MQRVRFPSAPASASDLRFTPLKILTGGDCWGSRRFRSRATNVPRRCSRRTGRTGSARRARQGGSAMPLTSLLRQPGRHVLPLADSVRTCSALSPPRAPSCATVSPARLYVVALRGGSHAPCSDPDRPTMGIDAQSHGRLSSARDWPAAHRVWGRGQCCRSGGNPGAGDHDVPIRGAERATHTNTNTECYESGGTLAGPEASGDQAASEEVREGAASCRATVGVLRELLRSASCGGCAPAQGRPGLPGRT